MLPEAEHRVSYAKPSIHLAAVSDPPRRWHRRQRTWQLKADVSRAPPVVEFEFFAHIAVQAAVLGARQGSVPDR